MQQDTTVTGVDWPVCHAWTAGDPDFTGEVTVFGAAEHATGLHPVADPDRRGR